MIKKIIQNWKGAVEIDGTEYNNEDALKIACSDIINSDYIILYSNQKNVTTSKITHMDSDMEYIIKVKSYMTKKSSPSFDFMAKWNDDNPMPLRTMVGTVEKETDGMVYMRLYGDVIAEKTHFCMRCGRPITNAISQFFGMGPECGGHNYVNPFDSEEELKEVVERYRKNYLQKITWEGWIIKSAIVEKEIKNNE